MLKLLVVCGRVLISQVLEVEFEAEEELEVELVAIV